MAHRTEYRFYMQPYAGDKTDIETAYGCDYMRFDDFDDEGDVQNAHEETYSEQSGSRVYIPPKEELAYKSYECKLRLLFTGASALENFRAFTDAYAGVKAEWSDTFRGRYATLLMTKRPKRERERLYGSDKYIVAEFTFANILGRTFETSQIN